MLKKGMIKRIGDGNSTNIWQDKWIPNHFSGSPLVVPDEEQLSRVSELITPSGGWNEDLVKQSFVGIDVVAILSTPVRGGGADSWGWEPERHGCYTVRSAYRLIYDADWHQNEQTQASTSGNPTWKRIWHLCVPPKIRVFWWHVVNGFIPTKGILHRRHIE